MAAPLPQGNGAASENSYRLHPQMEESPLKHLVRLQRLRTCKNCGGRALLEFDQLRVAMPRGLMIRLSSVPFHQCRECDHREMEARTRGLLEPEMEAMGLALAPGTETVLTVNWREVLPLELDLGDLGGPLSNPGGDRLFEVDWVWEA